MHAELQVLSPLVPVREVNFLRFCKQHAEGVWAVVDVSIDAIREPSAPYPSCRRLPSGCVVQDMPNGCSKVITIKFKLNYSCIILLPCYLLHTPPHSLSSHLLSPSLYFSSKGW